MVILPAGSVRPGKFLAVAYILRDQQDFEGLRGHYRHLQTSGENCFEKARLKSIRANTVEAYNVPIERERKGERESECVSVCLCVKHLRRCFASGVCQATMHLLYCGGRLARCEQNRNCLKKT